ncbi:hypothetical protein I5M27_14740 [Adhaeribacter sp. BT258]|uniref:Uncharacterized protein n=1 Tax=Adhaeribacter terrigena TaxID=2793070 RepID=A0ABS1C4D6_9BACT|nr:hypothetical protein [Adhaeribacter terrigena]
MDSPALPGWLKPPVNPKSLEQKLVSVSLRRELLLILLARSARFSSYAALAKCVKEEKV